jgi:hypothetical protein
VEEDINFVDVVDPRPSPEYTPTHQYSSTTCTWEEAKRIVFFGL